MKPGEERARSSRTVPTGLVVRKKKMRNSKIPASSREVVGETGERSKRKQVQPFEGWLFIFLGQPEICPYPGLSHLALPHWPIRRLLNWGQLTGSTRAGQTKYSNQLSVSIDCKFNKASGTRYLLPLALEICMTIEHGEQLAPLLSSPSRQTASDHFATL